MRERVTIVTLSVCLSVCVSLFYFGEGTVLKASETSAVTAVNYVGTASLNSLACELLARELLACGTLYQSSHLLHVVAGLQRLLSFPANSK